MPVEDSLIEDAKNQIETRMGWGSSRNWTNQDYIALSEQIQQQTGVPISHVTLKRIWGKVKYDSLPNTHTLDTLVQFLGFNNWRDFKSQHAKKDHQQQTVLTKTEVQKTKRYYLPAALFLILLLAVACTVLFIRAKHKNASPEDYLFTTKKIISQGLPNSVVFDYDARKAPGDSVIIQQSWDNKLRTKVSKDGHQHTSIYYYPDYFLAKLIVENQIVKQQPLLIMSDGWLPLVTKKPVPVYFRKEEAISNGKMSLPVSAIQAKNISFQPDPPTVLFTNVKDFGEVYSDDFVFETALKNDYHEGSAVCQLTKIYILCQGTAIWVPLCSMGCISGIDLYFTGFAASGKQHDLSAFGVDFDDYVNLRIVSKGGKADIFINGKPAYHITSGIKRSKIIGIDFSFQGTGSVDFVKLSNGNMNYDEEFGPSSPAGVAAK